MTLIYNANEYRTEESLRNAILYVERLYQDRKMTTDEYMKVSNELGRTLELMMDQNYKRLMCSSFLKET